MVSRKILLGYNFVKGVFNFGYLLGVPPSGLGSCVSLAKIYVRIGSMFLLQVRA